MLTGTENAFCSALADGPTLTLGRLKQNLLGLTQSLKNSLAIKGRHMIESGCGEEARESIAAFKQKRKPVLHPENTTTRGGPI